MKNIVIILSRHDVSIEKENALKKAFGEDVYISRYDGLNFDGGYLSELESLIDGTESDCQGKVVAIEPIAPFSILCGIVSNKKTLGVMILRSLFVNDENTGRNKVVGKDDKGRDIFLFSHYEEIEEIIFKTKKI